MNVGWAAVWTATGAVAAVVAVSVWARVRYARTLRVFRCRIGPPVFRLRRNARWRIGRRRAAWAGTVLLVSSGALRLFLAPVTTELSRTASIRPLEPGQVRGLGSAPVSVRLVTDTGRPLEIAVARAYAEELVGPFLAAALPQLPPAPRDPSG
jgi:hypothetical protein